MRDGFANECGESGGIHVLDDAGDDVALAADSADNWRFAGTYAARSAAATALIPMPVLGLAADESFVNFDNAAELSNVFDQARRGRGGTYTKRFCSEPKPI